MFRVYYILAGMMALTCMHAISKGEYDWVAISGALTVLDLYLGHSREPSNA